MQQDAHYYAVLAFCRACGFKKNSAYEVAYASQFVDDAKINHIVIQGDPGPIERDTIEGEPAFFNTATCHSYTRMKTFNYCAMVNNTCAFHFVPGCEGGNFSKRLRCREKSPIIMALLDDAMKEDNLVKLGMVLHAYADTFSHQGFSGLLSKVNDIKDCKPLSKIPWNWAQQTSEAFRWFTKDRFDRLFDSAMPAYGHGQAMVYPDLPHLAWSYQYDFSDSFSSAYKPSGEISNSDRYEAAFKGMQEYLAKYLEKYPQHRDEGLRFGNFTVLFETLNATKTEKGRIRNWKKTLKNEGLFEETDAALTYDEDAWLAVAFDNFDKKKFHQRKVDGAILSSTFPQSSWYKYYLATKWYKQKFFDYCSESGLKIPC
ncbi:MAG: DUF6765 family protein [Thermodesulfobacteriota bacterium]|nr:DUF6765 family protein [Thermodesulfobacteriota bacterium]